VARQARQGWAGIVTDRKGKAGIDTLQRLSRTGDTMAVATKNVSVEIKPPNMVTLVMTIEGISPYVQNKFSSKAREQMRLKQQAGDAGKSNKAREAKDFQACRVANVVMSRAKLAVFVEADGFDADDGTPLVKITKGKPEYHEACVRNDSGVADVRPRPMWREGWRASVRITYDGDMFKQGDVVNLFARAGMQVGVGEGRPDSKNSCGMGWGTWRVLGKGE
jgi:hypothetical protein